MRTDCSWSMSTAGLTAQEIRLPAQNLLLRGSHWHSMAGAKPSWKYHDLHNLYFTLDASMDYKLQSQKQVLSSFSEQARHQSPISPGSQPLPPPKTKPPQLTLSAEHVENDQAVPCFQRLTVSDHNSPPQTPSRVTKPLPPIPASAELSPDQSTDSEVEFFNGDDSHCLVSEPCSKHSPFRYGMPSRRSFRGCGQINYAYFEGPIPHPQQHPQQHPQSHPQQHPHPHSQPQQHPQSQQHLHSQPQQHPQQHLQQHPQSQQHPHSQPQQHPHSQPQQHPHPQSQQHPQSQPQQHPQQHPHSRQHPHLQPQQHPQKQRLECEMQQREQELSDLHLRQQERTQKKLRRSHSGPAGCFNKPTSFRLSAHHRNTQDPDKPEVPPRVPIPPRPVKTGDYRRWSAEVSSGANSDEDRPPKVPPREPLSWSNSPTPSPKTLPVYLNGIMPPTQSFAPDPKYVSRVLQRQNSEGSPCILPVMENGQKASSTHYFLLPQRPAYLDRHEKYLTDSRGTDASDSISDWDCQSKRKTTRQIDFV